MAQSKCKRFTDEQRVNAFVVRARRITSHSLWREQRELMERVREVQIDLGIKIDPETSERTYLNRQVFPAEELLESLAARLRPLTLESEDLHYTRVLKSIAALVPADQIPDYVEPIEEWHKLWDAVATRNENAQAFYIITEQGAASDQDLMYAWLYGDVVHADDKQAESKGLSVKIRYQAAAGIVTRMVDCTELTLLLVDSLVAEGILAIDSELFEREVVVEGTIFEETVVGSYSAEVGTKIPDLVDDFDPEHWQSIDEMMETYLPNRTPCQEWWTLRTRQPSRTWTWKIKRRRVTELLSTV